MVAACAAPCQCAGAGVTFAAMTVVHIIGAGLAGLSSAVRLAGAGRRVALYEAAPHAGGRCRSYFEPALDCSIDNGNHLMLGANHALMGYLDAIGARNGLTAAPEVIFPYMDLPSGKRWTLRPNAGPLPWWLLAPSRRVPDSRLADYFSAFRLKDAASEATVADVFDTDTTFFKRFWGPLMVAVLNTEVEAASARLMWPVIDLTFGRGAEACRAFVARDGLSASLIDPALEWLGARGCTPRFGARLRSIRFDGGRAVGLDFGAERVALEAGDGVVLAVPPPRAMDLLPGLAAPEETRAIVNAHYRVDRAPTLPGGSPLLGIIGGTAQWVFVRGDVISVTVSAADAMADETADHIAALLWADVARALDLAPHPLPPHRIVKERRATFAQTPDQVARRPGARTDYANLVLAGDWTDTGLPATIEGAVKSGHAAAEIAAAFCKK